jgi:hypothetical protein
MKRLLVGLMVTAVAALGVGGVTASASADTLQTFADNGAQVTIGPDGDSATIVLSDGTQDGGVFLKSKSQGGKLLNQVSFSFTSDGDVQGGAPRFSIPINTNGTGSISGYAFLDAANCGATVGPNTTVSTVVSTGASNCPVFFGPAEYADWSDFAAANPAYRTAPGAIPFIIADGTAGTYHVSSVVLR